MFCLPKNFLGASLKPATLKSTFNLIAACGKKTLPSVIDINAEDMMFEDKTKRPVFPIDEMEENAPNGLKTKGINGATIAPIDIDAWTCEYDHNHGTVDAIYESDDDDIILKLED